MEDKKLIPRRRVLGLGVALAGLCAGCAVLPAGSTESAAGSQAASGEKAADKVEKAPLEDINSVNGIPFVPQKLRNFPAILEHRKIQTNPL